MESHIGNIMTLSNSIIGVSILAMPFCFKQCGIILAILMLIISSVITRLTCHFLVKSAIMARRRTFELLAFHAFGTTGKFIVEIGIIGFLMGTCIAFFVIIGDLGPAILAKMMSSKPTDTLRTSLLVGVALFFVLPLGLLKNVDSLHSVCTATIGFYFCLVLKIVSESATHFLSGDWLEKVELWRPIGVLQCLPIFAMALACQTQLFEIYETISNPTLDKMNYIVRNAINICVAVYVCVGFFGYVAFSSQQFTGNILMSFSPSTMTDVMKIGFVLSVAFSFPLVIFPCRASLNSLLFKKGYNPYEGVSNHIPESRFKFLTVIIVFASLVIGILIPNIEVVLGLVGSTIGTMICLIFPVTCFICISTKNTNERLIAQILLFVGVIVMVMGTYANLYAMEEISNTPVVSEKMQPVPNPALDLKQDIINVIKSAEIEKALDKVEAKISQEHKNSVVKPEPVNSKPEEIRLEPPQPVEPQDISKQNNLPMKENRKPLSKMKLPQKLNRIETENKNLEKSSTESNKFEIKSSKKDNNKEPLNENATKKPEKAEATKNEEDFNIDAIKKEDTELQEDEKNKEKENNMDNEKLLKELKRHKEEQKSLLKEQKKLLQEFKQEQKQQQELAVENEVIQKEAIVEMAKLAIQKLAPKINSNNIENEPEKSDKLNDIILNDPIARQLLKMSNNSKIKSEDNKKIPVNDRSIPLPIAINRNMNEILNNKENVINGSRNVDEKEVIENAEPNNINLIQNDKQNELVDHQLIIKQEQSKDKLIKDTNLDVKPNLEKSQDVLVSKENEKPGENIKLMNEKKEEENINPGRDILANNESTENAMRNKREVDKNDEILTHSLVVENNEECALKDKTESPLIKLITELSKPDFFDLDSSKLMEGVKNELKAKSVVHLNRKK